MTAGEVLTAVASAAQIPAHLLWIASGNNGFVITAPAQSAALDIAMRIESGEVYGLVQATLVPSSPTGGTGSSSGGGASHTTVIIVVIVAIVVLALAVVGAFYAKRRGLFASRSSRNRFDDDFVMMNAALVHHQALQELLEASPAGQSHPLTIPESVEQNDDSHDIVVDIASRGGDRVPGEPRPAWPNTLSWPPPRSRKSKASVVPL
jgi:hypothetical protein